MSEKNKKPVSVKKEKKDIGLYDVIRMLIKACNDSSNNFESKEKFKEVYKEFLLQEISKHACSKNYNIAVLMDNTTLVKDDSDKLYRAISSFKDDKPLLLILLSRGGEPAPAYLIGKLCREHSNGRFVVAIPRYAKSAATLISCGADEIHMGSLSELGPIDPQLNGMPTLGLKNSIEHIAELVKNQPDSAELFARYLHRTIEPIQIGYYERVAKSLTQYADRLLKTHAKPPKNPSQISKRLVYDYQDHGFVIDKVEAEEVFGSEIVKTNTEEYKLADSIYSIFSEMRDFANLCEHDFYHIGTLITEPDLFKKDT